MEINMKKVKRSEKMERSNFYLGNEPDVVFILMQSVTDIGWPRFLVSRTDGFEPRYGQH